jgi:hypothetical protein
VLRKSVNFLRAGKLVVVCAIAFLLAGSGPQDGAARAEYDCFPVSNPSVACSDRFATRQLRRLPLISSHLATRQSHASSGDQAIAVSGRSITGPLPHQGVMILWGRHASKMVETKGIRYVALAPRRSLPMSVAIYARGPNGEWVVAFADDGAMAQQPPSLHLDASGQLHLIYAEYKTGHLRHRVFERGSGVKLHELQERSTAAWGSANFYFGSAMDESGQYFVSCAQNFTSNLFRCGQFENGRWRIALSRYVGPDLRLLYPNISAGSKDALIVSSGFPVGEANFGTRSETDVFRLTYAPDSGAGRQLGLNDGGELITQIGAATTGESLLDEDVERDAAGVRVLLTGTKTGDLSVLEIDTHSSAQRLLRLPARWGSAHNLQRFGSSRLIIGAGRMLVSSDLGETWLELSYEAAEFPKSKFQYLVAHTQKSGVSDGQNMEKITFLQEVRNVETNGLEVIEVAIDVGHLSSVKGRTAMAQMRQTKFGGGKTISAPGVNSP